MMKERKYYLAGLFVISLSILILGVAVPANADDAGAGTQADPVSFICAGIGCSQITDHNPDNDPWKGWFTLIVINEDNVAWNDFHFELSDISGEASSNVVFPNTAPESTQSGTTYTISPDQKQIDLFFEGDTVGINEIATFRIFTDNTDNHNPFAVTYWPTTTGGTGINGIAPEPVSSTLFLVGAATLGFRRFRKK